VSFFVRFSGRWQFPASKKGARKAGMTNKRKQSGFLVRVIRFKKCQGTAKKRNGFGLHKGLITLLVFALFSESVVYTIQDFMGL